MQGTSLQIPPSAPLAVTREVQPMAWRLATNLTMLMGAGLLAWSGAIHLDLWSLGYRTIPTIGPLFLMQAIVGFVLAAVVAGSRRLLPAVAGAMFLASTIGGLLLSVSFGLFNFKDTLTAPFAQLSLIVEATGIVVLAGASLLRLTWVRRQSDHGATHPAPAHV